MRAEKPYKRTERIEHQILEIFGEIVTKHISLTHLGFVTFTGAQITTDLKFAKIHFSVIKPRIDVEEIEIEMNKLSSAFRKYLGPELHIRFIPELRFIYDDTYDYTEKMEIILSKIK